MQVALRALQIWSSIKAVTNYWESLCKSKRPSNKSYETLVKYRTDVLVPCKLQFFAFVAGILKPFLQIFQTDRPMLPFMLKELERVFDQLIRLVMKRDAIKEADTIIRKLKEKWLKDMNNQLEEDLVDLGAATKDLLAKTQVSAEKKRKFKRDCKQIIITIILKLQERSPLKYMIVRNSSSLSPEMIIQKSDEASTRFRSLADRLYATQKIKAEVADKAKAQFDDFLKDSKLQHTEEFKNFDFKKDRLDSFLATYFAGSTKELWHVCKLIFTLSHGQSSIERGFSVNKEVLQDNLEEKSLISQRLVYDSLRSSAGLNIEEFEITQDLRRHCKLSSKRYKQDLASKKRNSVSISRELKRKQKLETFSNKNSQ